MYHNIFDCQAYACYLKDEKALSKSTSGGAFFAFAENVIKAGGVVFGAAFQKDFEVRHMGVETLEDLEKLRKSKYVQSRIADTYTQARTFLQDGRTVLFSGTPCQIAGLKSYLGKDYDNLLTIDLICHGVPSNKLLKEHIGHLEDMYGSLKEIQFRDKQNGWGNVSVSYQMEDEKKVAQCYKDDFFYGFDHYYFLRPSCYECQYRRKRSGADITIGDYWGIQKEHSEFTNNNRGISCIIIKSQKGNQLFQDCRDKLIYLESTVRKIVNYNTWLIGTPGKKIARKMFYERWMKGEKDLKKIYQYIERERKTIELGVIGSYSLRTSINFLHSYDPRGVRMQWHITNSGICSMTSENRGGINISDIHVSNDYRYQSIENDVEKTLDAKLSGEPSLNYIVIDFMEERFPLLFLNNNSIVTESEAYQEIQDQVTADIEKRVTMLELSEEYWKKCCGQFIKMLGKWYKPEQIILNCSYLVENYGWEGPEYPFENLSEIRQINEKLKCYYDYFINNMPGIHVIDEIEPERDFCFPEFAFGCEPVYYNRIPLCRIRDKMIEIMGDGQEWN